MTGSGGCMRSLSAVIWMSRTYWKSVWLRSRARIGMSCSSRSFRASRWSLYAARSSVTFGTGLTRPARTCFRGTGNGFWIKDWSSCCASVLSMSTRWISRTSRLLALSAIFSPRWISRSYCRAFSSRFRTSTFSSRSFFRSRASRSASSTFSSSFRASSMTCWISSLARLRQASSRCAILSSRFRLRRSISASLCERAAARFFSVSSRSLSFFSSSCSYCSFSSASCCRLRSSSSFRFFS
mmetsp:Transcript_41481/g.115281  ORF Transcript_41481/g.115281 Transcript_41481/m.115281 type:complete len:240 (+) Transcript_41481:303-1022(+)